MTDFIARAMAVKALCQGGASQYPTKSDFPINGIEGQLYVDINNRMIYCWDNLNSTYIPLNISTDTEIITKTIVEEVLEKEILDGGNYISSDI